MEPQVVIITGASSGIGTAVARRMARDGTRLALAARRVDRLEQVAADIERVGGQALVLPTDVTRQENVERMLQATLSRWGHVDVLFNNAGMGGDDLFTLMDMSSIQARIDLNLVAVIRCARLVLPVMVEQKHGHIINTSSLAGLVALPGSTLYSATKWGVVGFSDSLRREMKALETGVDVSAFCPGFTPSEISEPLRAHAEKNTGASFIPGLMSSEYVANQVVWLMSHPRRIFAIPKSWRALILLAYLWPSLADTLIKYFRPKKKGLE